MCPIATVDPGAADSHARAWLALPLMLVGCFLTAGPVLNLGKWRVEYNQNPAFEEAIAWRHGRLDLPTRERDTALHDGKIFSVHPPLFVIMSYLALQAGDLLGVPPDQFYPAWYVLMVAVPLPFVGFWAFQQVLRKPAWSAVLTAYWLLGTPLLPSLQECQTGAINPLNHVLANIGLMLIAGDLLGRRSMWPTALGILIAGWSRPHLAVFGLVALLIARQSTSHRRKKVAIIASSLAVCLGTIATLNWLKFGNPLEPGYRFIYDYRPQSLLGKRFLAHGVFSPRFLGENLWTMNLATPGFRLTSDLLTPDNDEWGAAIWITSPLLLGALLLAGRWWRNESARKLMLGSLAVIAVFLMYHSRGASTRGYHAYSLDFLAIWLVVIAPSTWTPRGRAVTLACFAWSAMYFHLIC